MKKSLTATAVFLLISCACLPMHGADAAQEKVLSEAGGTSYLYLPNSIDPDQTYWVVAGIHTYGGRAKGAGGIARWADHKNNVIVISPQFDKQYTYADPPYVKKLTGLFRQVQKNYRVHPKMFLFGFSGGSQFAHRFAMKQPELVIGVSAHSGGSWATGGGHYGSLDSKVKHIPFAISCGDKDTGKSWGTAPYSRLDWFNKFAAEMVQGGYLCATDVWPNTGHGLSGGAWKRTEECFALATTGRLPGAGDGFGKQFAELKSLVAKGEYESAIELKRAMAATQGRLSPESGWNDSKEAMAGRKKLIVADLATVDTSPATVARHKRFKAALAAVNGDSKPTSKGLCNFMEKCPPSFWKDSEGAAPLRSACNDAAEEYVSYLKEQKRFGPLSYIKYIRLWDGLPIAASLMNTYNAEAEKQLNRILAMQGGLTRTAQLKSFIRKWKIGGAVETAQAELGKAG